MGLQLENLMRKFLQIKLKGSDWYLKSTPNQGSWRFSDVICCNDMKCYELTNGTNYHVLTTPMLTAGRGLDVEEAYTPPNRIYLESVYRFGHFDWFPEKIEPPRFAR